MTRRVMTREETDRLCLAAQAGDIEARNDVVMSHRGLIHNFLRRYGRFGLEHDDAWQCGYIGLIKAVETFDPNRGVKFCTHGFWQIRAEIGRAAAQTARAIRIPDKKYWLAGRGEFDAPHVSASLDEYIGDSDDHRPRSATIVDEDSPNPEAEAGESERREQVATALRETLQERERLLLIRTYGLDGEPPERAVSFAPRWGVSKQWIYQVRDNAHRRLRRERPELGALLA